MTTSQRLLVAIVAVLLAIAALPLLRYLASPEAEPATETAVDPAITGSGGGAQTPGGTGESKSSRSPTTERTAEKDEALVLEADHRVRFHLRGRVVNRTQEGVPGAQVRFFADAAGDAEEPSIMDSVTSNDEGLFTLRLREVTAGAVDVTKERYTTARVAWTPPVSEEAGTEVVEIESDGGEAAEESTELLVVTLETETAISGRVALPEGHSGKFMVSLQRYSGPNEWHDPVIREFSEDGGGYYFGGIRAATYRLWAYAHGTYRSSMQEVAVAESEHAEDIDFGLLPGCGLEGRVYARQTGQPISDSVVYFPREYIPGTVNFIQRSEVDPRVRNSMRTTETGNFRLHDLPPGKHLLRILHPDYKPFDLPVELKPDQVAVVEAPLEQGTGIRGEVLDEEAEPIDGATIIAIMMTPERDTAQMTLDNVDDQGGYYIRNLNPGTYIVVRILQDAETGGMPKVTMTNLNAKEDAIVDFVEIPNLATARGRVTDTDGNPMPLAQVMFMVADTFSEFTFKSDITDEEGRYEIRNITLGTQLVGVARRSGGSWSVVKPFEMKEPIDYDCDVVFHNLVLAGQVVSAVEKKPLAGEVFLFDENQEEFKGRAECDDKGNYSYDGLQPGRYTAIAVAHGFQPKISDVFELDEQLHREQREDFKLQVGGTVEVMVIDGQGAPIDGARVHIYDFEGQFVNDGLPPLTAGGVYRFAMLRPGEHTLKVIVPRGEGEEPGAPVERAFTAVVGKTAKVTVEIPR